MDKKEYTKYKSNLVKSVAKELGYSVRGRRAFKIMDYNGLYVMKSFFHFGGYLFRMWYGIDIMPTPTYITIFCTHVYISNQPLIDADPKTAFIHRVENGRDVQFREGEELNFNGIISDCAQIDGLLHSMSDVREYMEIKYRHSRSQTIPPNIIMGCLYMMMQDGDMAKKYLQRGVEIIGPVLEPKDWNNPKYPLSLRINSEGRYEISVQAKRYIELINSGEWA